MAASALRPVRPLARCARLLALALLAGCAAAPEAAPPTRRLPAELRSFLPDPSTVASADAASSVAAIHRRLLEGADPNLLRDEAEELAPATARGAAWRLLLAEIALVAGDWERALAEAAALGFLPESALVSGRASEGLGDTVAAVTAYRLAGARFPVALERSERLEPAAVSELHRRIEAALSDRRVEAARADLTTLAEWRPEDPATWRLAARVGFAAGDRRAELEALRALESAGRVTAEDRLRRAALEVEVGNAAEGLELLEREAAARPGDPDVRREWLRARVRFRLANSPDPVRRAAAAPELTRADFALLLYWLVPEVRSARGGTPRIATDILEHPAREEIARVANLDLLRVDEALHLFEPDRPLRRLEAFRALARLEDGLGSSPRGAQDLAASCARAASSGWIDEAGDCLPAATVSGTEALDWIRTLARPDGTAP